MIRILIEKEVKQDSVGREYQKIADSGNDRDAGAVYAYVEFPSTKTVTTKIMEQFVSDDLDIPAVIAVINGLQKKSGLDMLP